MSGLIQANDACDNFWWIREASFCPVFILVFSSDSIVGKADVMTLLKENVLVQNDAASAKVDEDMSSNS